MPDASPIILILSGVRGDTRRYRTFHLFEQTRLLGIDSQLSHITDGRLRKLADRASIVILHRAAFSRQIAWLESEIHRKKGYLIQDIDDLLFEPGMFKYIHSVDFSDSVRASLYQQEMGLYRKTVESCDAITASTEYLAERVSLLGKTVRVHRNAFSLEMLDQSERAFQAKQGGENKIVIGYASGTATHDLDFALIKPALKSILNRFPKVELRLVGPLDPGDDWGDLENRIHHLQLVPWRQLPGILSGFDINLAPLRIDNPFGQSKSEIKFMEAALVRVPTIASPSEAFIYAIQHAETGLLARDLQEWEQFLEQLIQHADLRHEMGESAYQDVLKRYHPTVRAQEFIDHIKVLVGWQFSLPDANFPSIGNQPGTTLSFWSSAQDERTPTLIQMGWYTLQYRGLVVVLKQIWIYLRRLLAPLIPFQKVQ